MLLTVTSLLLSTFVLTGSTSGALHLSQVQEQILSDRLFQTNLRGPRWTGNENQNVLKDLIAGNMKLAGLDVNILNYTFTRWDPRWWYLSLNLKNGTAVGLPTTGYWPYSGDSGPGGITGPLHDVGSFGLLADDATANNKTLNLSNLPSQNTVVFFDNPSPTKNYSLPGYRLLGTSRNIPPESIPELGNLRNPHWQSAKTLNFTSLKQQGVAAVVASWVNISDEDAALQFLPNSAPPYTSYDVPALYVGNSTGKLIRQLAKSGDITSATVVLDAPNLAATTHTVWGRLKGSANSNTSIIVYTHSDGPSIVEENGPILLLTLAEFFSQNLPKFNIDFVVTTGHVSGGHVDEKAWMTSNPEILATAKAAIVCEHFGAMEYKDTFTHQGANPVYKATGKLEPMWTMANDSSASNLLHSLYFESFVDTPDSLRMALLAPQTVNGTVYQWYGAGGSSTLGGSKIPTIGIIPQPDYLWASMVDGGWSRVDMREVITQLNVIISLISRLDEKFASGDL